MNAEVVNWREKVQDREYDPDDEELEQTPVDVVLVLGFDPAEAGTD